jgi:hypothetical protein
MPEIEWPGRRGEIVDALQFFATIRTVSLQEQDQDFTNAVHALVDDTFWDLYYEEGNERFNPVASIGRILRDHHEVDLIAAVLDPLLTVLRDLGPVRPDPEYLAHPRWPDVATTAAAAHQALCRADKSAAG